MRLTMNFGMAKDGVNIDTPPELLDLAQLSYVRNMRYRNGYLQRSGFFKKLVDCAIAPTFIMPVQVADSFLWVVAGDDKVFGLRAQTLADITNVGGLSTSTLWDGCTVGGLPIVTNAADVPQVWNPVSLTQPLVDLPNWPSNDIAIILRSFNSVVIAIGLEVSGTTDLYSLKISAPADPGNVPPSWDETDPTQTVLLADFLDTNDVLVDGLALQDIFMAYKQSSMWQLKPSGGGGAVPAIVDIACLSRQTGLLSKNCLVGLNDDQHFVVTNDDVVLVQGGTVKSVIDQRNRRWFFDNLDPNSFHDTTVYRNDEEKEIVTLFTTTGGERLGAVWNWSTDQWSIRDGKTTGFAAYGAHQASDVGTTWEEAIGSWEDDVGPWVPLESSRLFRIELGAAGNSLVVMNSATPGSVDVPVSYIERLDWPFGEIGKNGQVFATFEKLKSINRVWPRIEAPAGTEFLFEYAMRETKAQPYNWKPVPLKFNPDRGEQSISIFKRCRYFSWRLSCAQPVIWKVTGMDVELQIRGRY